MCGVWSESKSVRLLAWQAENSTSVWRSLWERSLLVSSLSTEVFPNDHGVVPENVRSCGFKRKSSNLDRAPKMWDYVLQSSWDSFLVTLPSISSVTFAVYSSVIPGADDFIDWLFLVDSCFALDRAATFRLFPMLPALGKGSTTVSFVQW